MENYNPFSMAVKMKYSPPSISALLRLFSRICALSSCSGEGGSVEGQLAAIRACLPKPHTQISLLWQKYRAQT